MVPKLRRGGVLIGLAVLSALVIGAAAAQRPAAGNEPPAQLDRTFGGDADGGFGGASPRDPGMSTDTDGGVALGFDGGTGPGGGVTLGFDGGTLPSGGVASGAGLGDGGEGVGGSGGPDAGTMRGREEGAVGADAGTPSSHSGGHTNIIVYGPNGISAEDRASRR
ncbi:MAG TPA: hypothetical protein VE618_00470 [Myxococcaceae bacterium]|nr:hypothetical protein [Myxococcaceae bacterium]